MSNNDLPLQLHYALFKGSRGFVLKPSEMTSQGKATDVEPGQSCTHEDVKPTTESELQDVDGYWPPPRKQLQCVTINLFSLHNLPTVRNRCMASHCSPTPARSWWSQLRLPWCSRSMVSGDQSSTGDTRRATT
jgi:hypothetical protein|eukprot:2085704-Prymnesium_polylepis.2